MIGFSSSAAHAEGIPGWLAAYRAPVACPSASSFREEVEQRLSGALDALARSRVSVTIAREASGNDGRVTWRSELTFEDPNGPTVSTDVTDGSCAALVEALAFLVALRVDGASEPGAPALTVAPEESEIAQPIDRGERAASADGYKGLQVGAALLGSSRSALGPEPALGLGLGVTLQWTESGIWAPRLEVSVSRLETSDLALTVMGSTISRSRSGAR